GSTLDTASGYKLAQATIYVLRAKDSILINFTYARTDGTFSIDGLLAGNFILLITYPDYADYAESFKLDELHAVHDVGAVPLQLKSKLLQEVIVRGQVRAIRIKGDTTEYDARAYVIQPNDKVEDLVRQLPGLQVDKDGRITANGEAVTKVLVDGEEFFGDDPTLVTRNLRSDMVDKIQLYDKKSDQAAFTGIDDGVRIKTLNVKLKSDKNTGVFGKVEAGVGDAGFYQAQALYNKFKPGTKYAAYATAANTGKINLGMTENNKLGTTSNAIQIGDAVVVPAAATDDMDGFSGAFNGRGLPAALTGGLHYDSKWNKNKETINVNYKAGSLDVTGVNTILNEQSLPAGVLTGNTSRYFDQSAFRQKMDAMYQVNLDSFSSVKLATDATIKNMQAASNYEQITMRDGIILNTNKQSQDFNSEIALFNASGLYTKRFHRPGRTLSWNVAQVYARNKTDGYQKSTLVFYDPSGAVDSTQATNQYRKTDLLSSVLSSNITWSEPLSRSFSLVVNYGVGVNRSYSDRRTYNESAAGKYDVLDTTYSNDYRFDQLANQAGVFFTYKKEKHLFYFGTKTASVGFRQVNLFTDNAFQRNFVNWLPQASYQYRSSQQKNISVNYDGGTMQPTIDQLQPVRVNNDPLNVVLGNPGLKPSFINRLSLRSRFASPFSGRAINFRADYRFTSSAIVNSIYTTDNGKTTTRFVNLSSKIPSHLSMSSAVNLKIKPIDVSIELELISTISRRYTYVNNELNRLSANTYGASVQLQKFVHKKYNFSVVVGPNYAVNKFSLQPQHNNNARGFYASAWGSVFLPHKFQLGTDIGYNYTAATQSLAAQDQTIWNASVNKTFLKTDNLKLSFSVNDILSRNINFNRTVTVNEIIQSNINSIRRYFLLSVIWDFNKFGGQPPSK
ncbi:MAG TPA: outer membrane beta-barrel protein, partial [Niastella sp.]